MSRRRRILVAVSTVLSGLIGVLSLSSAPSVAAESVDESIVQPMIVGGVPAEARWGNVVARVTNSRSELCTGIFVSRNWVLTAAHCISARMNVSFGSTSMPLPLSIEGTGFSHPYFDEDIDGRQVYDFGLVRLDTPAPIDEAVLPVLARHTETSAFDIGKLVTSFGWGVTSAGGTVSPKLLSGDMFVTGFDSLTGIETNAESVSSCNGDSGGPIVSVVGSVTYLVGVTSYGPVKCDDFSVGSWIPYGLAWINSTIESGGGFEVTRIFGLDRYETASAVGAIWKAAGTVFVATGDKFPDALAAGAAASAYGVPVLLVRPNSVPASTRLLLERLGPTTVVLAGGTAAISSAVETELRNITGANIVRLGGVDRYETADLLTGDAWDGFVSDRVWVASGRDFADPLIASTAAAVFGDAFVLIDGLRPLPAYTRNRLAALDPLDITVVGAATAFAPGTLDELRGIAPVTTVFDANVSDRSVKVWSGLDVSTWASLATVANFPDALTAVPFSALEPVSPLMLVPTTCVTSAVKTEFTRLGVTRLAIFGGPAALSEQVEALAVCP